MKIILENDGIKNEYIIVSSLTIKKGKIVLAYNVHDRITKFFYPISSKDGTKYIEVGEKEKQRFDNIFNIIEDDMIYMKPIRKLGDEIRSVELKEKDIKYLLIDEAVKKTYSELKRFFPECNADNYIKRKNTLQYKLAETDSNGRTYSGYSRWDNIIYINDYSFISPKMLLNTVAHEMFHVFGTQTKFHSSGMLRKSVARNSGFESKGGFCKGINEGFIQKYANMISESDGGLKFETKIATLIELILDDDLALDNTNSDTTKLMTLARDKEELIAFIKVMDYYNLLNTRYLNWQGFESDAVSFFKHDFITDAENYIINFFFQNLKKKIKSGLFEDKSEIADYINTFKMELVFEENLNKELDISKEYVELDKFEEVKQNFVNKSRNVMLYANKFISHSNKKDDINIRFASDLKNICKLTCKITNIYEIRDSEFREIQGINGKEKIYLITTKDLTGRNFFIAKQLKNGRLIEILNKNVEKINEIKDAKLYENLNILDDVREKERRSNDKYTYSIYRTHEGNFGIGVVVDKKEKIIKSMELEELHLSYELLDDAIEDFSYLKMNTIPEHIKNKIK